MSAPPILYCSFCGKSQDEVQKLIAGTAGNICENCVEVCMNTFHKAVSAPVLSDISAHLSATEIADVRKFCLDKALCSQIDCISGAPHPASVVSAARDYTDFILGASDAGMPRAARDLAEKVTG